jgi:hypothetical protein
MHALQLGDIRRKFAMAVAGSILILSSLVTQETQSSPSSGHRPNLSSFREAPAMVA